MASLNTQFQMLRARIENSMATPLSVLISSAQTGDGKSACARGLAESMSAAGYRTLLVDLDHDNPTPVGLPIVKSLVSRDDMEQVDRGVAADSNSDLSTLALTNPLLSSSASKENVEATLAHLLTQFDAVVIDGPRLSHSSIGVLFATACDSVILTAREGRSISNEDRALVDILERDGVNFLGVVAIGKAAIKNFTRLKSKFYPRPASLPIMAQGRKVDAPMAASRVS